MLAAGKSINVQLHLIRSVTLSPNWYTGHLAINHLAFENCNIRTIEPNAFVSPALAQVTHLTIGDQRARVLIYREGCLDGLSSLRHLQLNRVAFVATVDGWLHHHARRIESLSFTNATTASMIRRLFNESTPFERLRHISIINTSALSIITSRTFGSLPAIVTLNMSSSGIIAIELGAFDTMAVTLRFLKLDYNRLRTIPVDLFAFMTNTTVLLYHNPWRCQCYLLALHRTLYIDMNQEFMRRCSVAWCRHTDRELLEQQPSHSCLYATNTAAIYARQPRLAVKVHGDLVTIDHRRLGKENTKIYVLIVLLRSFALENAFQAQCFIEHSHRQPIHIALDAFQGHQRPLILYVLDKERRGWPRNIAAIRPVAVPDDYAWLLHDHKVIVNCLVAVTLLLALFLGAACGFALLCRHPVLLKDLERVVVLEGGGKRHKHVFIMPKNWKAKKPKKPVPKDACKTVYTK